MVFNLLSSDTLVCLRETLNLKGSYHVARPKILIICSPMFKRNYKNEKDVFLFFLFTGPWIHMMLVVLENQTFKKNTRYVTLLIPGRRQKGLSWRKI